MIAANIMSTDIATVRSSDTLEKALTLMNEKRVREIAVVDDERRVVGLLTPDTILNQTVVEKSVESAPKERESLSPAGRFFEKFRGLSSRDVCEVMDRDVVKVVPETSTDEVSKILLTRDKRVSCVAVVDDREVLLGIIRPLDVVKRLWEHVDGL
jgi:CBS-domain-containing membrane protein